MIDKIWVGAAALILTAVFAAVAFGAGHQSEAARISAGIIASLILLGGAGIVGRMK